MKVKYISGCQQVTPDCLDELLDEHSVEWITLDKVNWSHSFPYRPEVRFRIAHADKRIFLNFFVVENDIRAVCDADNGRCWEDSCVEFFLQPDGNSPLYYNFEFSCVGFKLVGGGEYGRERGKAPADVVSKIATYSSLGNAPLGQKYGKCEWTLSAIIPVEALYLSNIDSLSGMKMRGNFYKCGDFQPTPHFLSWTEIKWEKPQFHLPQYFGEIDFEDLPCI